MVVQKTVLKVDLSCDKCRKKLLKAVTGLEGVDKIELDTAKETITVTGTADPYEIIIRARKAGRYAQVVTIGPPPAPAAPAKKPEEKKDDSKPEDKKMDGKKDDKKTDTPTIICHHPHYVYNVMPVEEPYASCSIL
uniref:HMA domain-containing protein n=1 Tax=Kalanchoe fedtschenkoi TaxID=63787 RepID=A0A7N0UF33_KALFE